MGWLTATFGVKKQGQASSLDAAEVRLALCIMVGIKNVASETPRRRPII